VARVPSSHSGSMLRMSIIIPTLDEAENLPHLLPLIPSWVDEIVLVDGYSTDRTIEVARSLRPDVRIVLQEGRGKGAALRTGFAAATGDIVIMLDADSSTDPAELPFFIGALLAGADFAKGTRFVQGGGTTDMPLIRVLGNQVFVLLVRWLFGGSYTDLCYGYNAFWKRAISQLNLDADGFEIETQMNIRALSAGLKVAEVPSFEHERLHGVGKLKTIPDGWRVLKQIVSEYLRHRRRRGTGEPELVSRDDEFAQVMHQLFREGILLRRSREHLSSSQYQLAVEAFKANCQELLALEAVHPDSRQIQDYYLEQSNVCLWSQIAHEEYPPPRS